MSYIFYIFLFFTFSHVFKIFSFFTVFFFYIFTFLHLFKCFFATFRVARFTLQTRKLWLAGVATDRHARYLDLPECKVP